VNVIDSDERTQKHLNKLMIYVHGYDDSMLLVNPFLLACFIQLMQYQSKSQQAIL
jgi:hypothetical protein